MAGHPDYFFVMNADVCGDFPLNEMLEFHKTKPETTYCTILGTEVCLQIDNCLIMSPPEGLGDILFFPVRPSVCLSVRHKSCPLYNSKTVKDISMKLDILIKQDKMMCHAQEP